MKAQSLSINLSTPCDAHCPFCISRLTHKTGVRDNDTLMRHLHRALHFAAFHRVDTCLITGSGEPTADVQTVLLVCRTAIDIGIPKVELQTNGLRLSRQPELLQELARAGVSTIAVSMAHPKRITSCRWMDIDPDELDHSALFAKIDGLGMTGRISLNLSRDCFRDVITTEPMGPPDSFPIGLDMWADTVKSWGVRQISLRELGMPSQDEGHGEAAQHIRDWIRDNGMPPEQVEVLRRRIEDPDRILRRLDFGPAVHDFRGLSAVVLTCMTDNPDPDEIRSLILQPDGHVYHSWNYTGSILL